MHDSQSRLVNEFEKLLDDHIEVELRVLRSQDKAWKHDDSKQMFSAIRDEAGHIERFRESLDSLLARVDPLARIRIIDLVRRGPEFGKLHPEPAVAWGAWRCELMDYIRPSVLGAAEPDAHTLDPNTALTVSQMVDMFGVPKEAMRKRLRRWRDQNRRGSWHEIADPKPNEERYSYEFQAIKHIIDALTH